MIAYQYQILRFLPDRVNGEFVNLGVVVFDKNSHKLKARFLEKTSRVSMFFPEIDGRYLQTTLKFLKAEFQRLSDKLEKELPLDGFTSLEGITRSILPVDDSAMIFSDVKVGQDVNLSRVCTELYNRVVKKNLSDQDEMELKNDREVWQKIYKEYFEKYDINKKLHAHTIKTKNDSVQFDKAWKNGRWHCFETVSFDLVKRDSIKNKVYRWSGKLAEMETAKESFNIYLLSVMPKDDELKKFVKRKLNNLQFDDSAVKIVTEDEAEALAKKFQREMNAHH